MTRSSPLPTLRTQGCIWQRQEILWSLIFPLFTSSAICHVVWQSRLQKKNSSPSERYGTIVSVRCFARQLAHMLYMDALLPVWIFRLFIVLLLFAEANAILRAKEVIWVVLRCFHNVLGQKPFARFPSTVNEVMVVIRNH